MQHFANWSLHLRGAYELSNPCSKLLTSCLSQLFLCSTFTPVLSLRLTHLRLQTKEPTQCVFSEIIFQLSLAVPTVSANIVDRRMVATLQNERGGAQQLNHRRRPAPTPSACTSPFRYPVGSIRNPERTSDESQANMPRRVVIRSSFPSLEHRCSLRV